MTKEATQSKDAKEPNRNVSPEPRASRLLLVTGSRHFSRTSFSKRYAMRVLSGHMLESRCDLVMHGGAPGADTIAEAVCRACGISQVIFYPEGRLLDTQGKMAVTKQWRPIVEKSQLKGQDFLDRDLAMVNMAKRFQQTRGTVQIVGLLHPDSETHGTQYTLDAAVDAGFEPLVFTFPLFASKTWVHSRAAKHPWDAQQSDTPIFDSAGNMVSQTGGKVLEEMKAAAGLIQAGVKTG